MTTILLIALTVVCAWTGNAAAQMAGSAGGRLYGSAEYLLWWTKNANVPPLATTSANPLDNGILGRPTTVLLATPDGDYGTQHGGRFRLGYWLPTEKPLAVEGGLRQHEQHAATEDG